MSEAPPTLWAAPSTGDAQATKQFDKFELLCNSGDQRLYRRSYAGAPGALTDTNSSFYIFGGAGAGQQRTLAELQSGAVNGIDGNTAAALWIGITNTNQAEIYDITVATPEPASLSLLAGALAGLGLLLKRKRRG